MQGAVLTFTPPLSFNKPRTPFHTTTTTPSFSSYSFIPRLPCIPLISSSSRVTPLWGTPLHSSLTFHHPNKATVAAADSFSDNSSSTSSSSLLKTVQLGALFCLLFTFNVYFNIYNKQVLKVFLFPITVTAFQFAIGTLIVAFMWCFKRPKVTSQQLLVIFPLAVVHTLGNVFTNMSLGKVAVSFTHTVKSSEPFFTVILSSIFLKEMPTAWVLSSLVPIVGGVALASATEVSFNWIGFWSAMASNLANQFRNVLSKTIMVKKCW